MARDSRKSRQNHGSLYSC